MRSLLTLLTAALLLLSLLANSLRADDAAAASFQSRMRDTLRATMQQLSDAQNQVATLQAAQAQSDKDKADLQAKVDALTAQMKTLTQQSADDRDAANKSIAELKDQSATQTKQIAALNDALGQWKVAYNQMAALAKSTEDKRAALNAQTIMLKRLVDDREVKNAELYNAGKEILDRYEKFGLGDALAAKEPFIGVTRARLETLVQDYKDKLLDRRVLPGQSPTTPPPLEATTGVAGNSSAPAGARPGEPAKRALETKATETAATQP